MPIYQSNTSSASRLNTSAISVPSVATMVQHLLDNDPHPQYLLAENLSSAINTTINIDDLANVKFGLGIAKDNVIVYNGTCWTNTPASALFSSMDVISNVSSSLVTLSSGVESNTSTIVANVSNISSVFSGMVEFIEEKVLMNQVEESTPCSAVIGGHIMCVYDTNSRYIVPDIIYSSGYSTMITNFSGIKSEEWTVVHTKPISTVITSNIISKII